MIRTLRALFLSRLLREKLLLVAFAAFGLLWWLSAFSSRVSAFSSQQRRTSTALAEQQQWLDNRRAIEAAAHKAAAQLDPAQTLDGPRLLAAIGNLTRDAGMRNTVSGGLTPQSDGQFSIYTLDYTINRVDWKTQLLPFYYALQKRSPYIGIERFTVTADPSGALLNVALRVSSMEFTR